MSESCGRLWKDTTAKTITHRVERNWLTRPDLCCRTGESGFTTAWLESPTKGSLPPRRTGTTNTKYIRYRQGSAAIRYATAPILTKTSIRLPLRTNTLKAPAVQTSLSSRAYGIVGGPGMARIWCRLSSHGYPSSSKETALPHEHRGIRVVYM